MTGVFDAATKTAEGFKNTTTILENNPGEQRARLPRAFYGKEKYFRTYFDNDAELIMLLNVFKREDFKELSLLTSFEIFPDEKNVEDCFILGLFIEALLLWDCKKEKIAWIIDSDNLMQVTKFNDAIHIQLKKATPEIKVIDHSSFIF